MKLILVRHGQSKANEKRENQGSKNKWLDTPLTKKGKDQAKKVAERLKNENFTAIFCSKLKRAKQTAKQISKYHKTKIIYDPRLNEKFDKESSEDFFKRVFSFFNEKHKKYNNKTILIIAHGGVNSSLLAISTGSKIKAKKLIRTHFNKQRNTGVSIIERQGKSYKIHIIGCINHLEADKKIINAFEKIQKIPYRVSEFKESKINNKLKCGDCRHKSLLLVKTLKKQGYQSKLLKVIFNWNDLPIPKKILNNLKKSSKVWAHDAVAVLFEGNYLRLDPTWNPELEKLGFPITKNWSGLEDTKQITNKNLYFYKIQEFEKNKDKILKKHKIHINKKEALNKWLDKNQ